MRSFFKKLVGCTDHQNVKNLSGEYTTGSNFRLSYKIEERYKNLSAKTDIYLDTRLVASLPDSDNATDIIIGTDGSHGLSVVRNPIGSFVPRNYSYGYGNTVALRWDRSISPDVTEYQVLQDDDIIHRVDRYVVDVKKYEATFAGGRYSVHGEHSEQINKTFTVEFGSYYFIFDSNIYSFVAKETTYQLPYGIELTLHDDPLTYSDFDIQIGVDNCVEITNVIPGTNTYQIVAVDKYGNVSDPIEKTVYVTELPDSTIDINFEDHEIYIAPNSNITHVKVYADYSVENEIKLPYVHINSPIQTIVMDNTGIAEIEPLPDNTLFYLFPVVNGVEHKNTTLYRWLPSGYVTGNFGAIGDISYSVTKDREIYVTWTYQLSGNDKLDYFIISHGSTTLSNTTTIDKSDTVSLTGYVLTYTKKITTLASDGTYNFAISSYDINDNLGETTDTITLTVDVTAPILSGDLFGKNI